MKNIQELKEDLINTENNAGYSPDLTVVGKREFDALMLALECRDPNKDEILEAIDNAKLSILRGMHSGDKVANLLVDETEAVNLICQGMKFRCHECCGDTYILSCALVIEEGPPVCPKCDQAMSLISAPDDIMRSYAHRDAEAYALRITQIKNSKKDKS